MEENTRKYTKEEMEAEKAMALMQSNITQLLSDTKEAKAQGIATNESIQRLQVQVSSFADANNRSVKELADYKVEQNRIYSEVISTMKEINNSVTDIRNKYLTIEDYEKEKIAKEKQREPWIKLIFSVLSSLAGPLALGVIAAAAASGQIFK